MRYLLLAASFLLAITIHAADQPKAKTRPFRGTIKTINKAAQVIVLRGPKAQTFKIIPDTKIRRDGKPIGFEDIRVGDTLGGFARQAPAGHWEALTLNFGVKAPPEASGSPTPAPAAKKPQAKP
jgi:hypothetical protein